MCCRSAADADESREIFGLCTSMARLRVLAAHFVPLCAAVESRRHGKAKTSRSWRQSGCRSHNTGSGMGTERTENDRGQRNHRILKTLVVLSTTVAMLGPTVFVISDAWAKGGGAGSGGGAPGASGGGGNSGG